MNNFLDREVETIAVLAHEVNRAYCLAIGDKSQKPWGKAPQWQKDSAMDGVRFHLKLLEAGKKATPEQSHKNWLKQKIADGWKYGKVKDVVKKTHPCFRQYDKLPLEQRAKDFLFRSIVETSYAMMTEHT